MVNVLMNFHTNDSIVGQIESSRLLTFAKNNIEKNVKERVLLKNYKELLNVRYINAFLHNYSLLDFSIPNISFNREPKQIF